MKVIPFKERDADYRVSVRDNIKLDGIPYIWSSNLSDEQLRDIYNRLLRARFFVRKPDIKSKKPISGVGVAFWSNLAESQFEYEDGLCKVSVVHDHAWVIYRTAEQWEAWAKAMEKKEEAKKRVQKQKQALRIKHAELQSKGASLIDSGRLEEAEECLLECHRLFLKHANVIRYSEAKLHLLQLYRRYNNPSRGLAFLSDNSSDDYDYYLLAEQFSGDPGNVEAVLKEGIKRSQDPGYLYKRLCLYFQKKLLLDKAIYYCEEAIVRGLGDDTKSGFFGRLQRLRKYKAKVTGPGSGK